MKSRQQLFFCVGGVWRGSESAACEGGRGLPFFLIFFVCIESLLAWRSHDNLVLQ